MQFSRRICLWVGLFLADSGRAQSHSSCVAREWVEGGCDGSWLGLLLTWDSRAGQGRQT